MEYLLSFFAFMFVMGLIILRLSIYVDLKVVINHHEHQLNIAVYIWKLHLLQKKSHDFTQKQTEAIENRLEKMLDLNVRQLLQLFKEMLLLSKDMLNQLTFHRFDWQTDLGTGEASTTGTVIGGLWTIKSMIVSFLVHVCQFHCQPQTQVSPQFEQKQLATTFNCIVSIKVGKAIFMLMKSIYHIIKTMKKVKENQHE